MRTLSSLALAALLALPAAAQQPVEVVRPGTPLDTTFIHTREDRYAVFAEHQGDTVRAGTVTLLTRVDSASGVRRVVRVERHQFQDDPESYLADSVVVEWGTLLPVSAHMRGDERRDFHYGPDSLRIVSGNPPAGRTVALQGPLFYRMPDVMLRALPVRVGYMATVPTHTNEGAPASIHFTVTAEAQVRTVDGATCPVLVVRSGDAQFPATLYVSTGNRVVVQLDTPRARLVRLDGCP